ncbi:unnamed protein product [Phytophthora fragariaefolia]|uniref:Unnamed protein product n=1 Tax=Phytophthora fragariaefolia TaxID=1490495 RepID=A0A9W6XQ96_9STRA|nr:unnamed protein product [Phytophthora fragariaefolia]
MSENDDALSGRDEDDIVKVLALVAGYCGVTYFDKEPLHSSILTGSNWMTELIEGNPKGMFNSYRMTKPVFRCFVLLYRRQTRHQSGLASV